MVKINKKTTKKITFSLFSILFFVGLLTYKDYGISIDEEFQRNSGFYWLNYVLSFTPFEELKNLVAYKLDQIKGFTLPSPVDNPYYGVVFDLPVAFFEVILNINDPKNYFHFRHFLNFTIFFIASIFFYKLLLNRFQNCNISLIGTIFFVLSPRIYGNSFYNNKDIIFLSLLTIALYFCFKVFDKINFKNLLIFSLIAAICTCSRIIGILLIISFLFFYFLSVLSNKKNLDNFWQVIICFILYCAFIIIFWPLLWSYPLNNFIDAFKYFSSFPLHPEMLFNGKYIQAHFLPYHYIFIWIFITTPILYSMLFILGYVQTFKRFFLRFINIKENKTYEDFWRNSNEKKDLFIFFILTAVLSYLITFQVPLYNGWRHIYFLNVFIIYLSVIGFYRVGIYLKRKFKKNFHYHLSILFIITIIFQMIVYHPFQNIYFNNYFNNISHNSFEIDYYGLSGKKSLKEILSLEKNNKIIKIGVASWLPLERSIKLLNETERKRIKIVSQNFNNADYIYTNFISEVDKSFNDKYVIPANFIKINEFIIDSLKVYEVYKKIN